MSKWCNAKLHQICSNQETNSSICILCTIYIQYCKNSKRHMQFWTHNIYKKKILNSYCWIFFYKSHSEHSILNCTTSRHTTYHLNSSSSMEVCLCEYSIQKICILYSVDITMLKLWSKCAYCAKYTQLTTRHWNSELSGILNSVHRTFNLIHFKGLRLI